MADSSFLSKVPNPVTIKNIDHGKVVNLVDLVSYQEGQVVSRTLSQHKTVTLTLFAFETGEGISTHTTPGDAMVQVLDGTAEVTIDGDVFTVGAGQSIVMPANTPHGLKAKERFKMLLTLIKEKAV
ncbi:cupin domain-containing protein [Maridesulfovibrio ferrireducens]|uniref:cupin domain-containing protein n=1 Tax=Maridesulfovibrio ferrireducens TaxID=246191 RepID=UPI001A2D97E7|nr:cupin domain-containing protein [Maridesulfovibrio ferrireducens]MBI9109599.1 cupin domain-containing protein [Maridesulfovibrio ferrireducens]